MFHLPRIGEKKKNIYKCNCTVMYLHVIFFTLSYRPMSSCYSICTCLTKSLHQHRTLQGISGGQDGLLTKTLYNAPWEWEQVGIFWSITLFMNHKQTWCYRTQVAGTIFWPFKTLRCQVLKYSVDFTQCQLIDSILTFRGQTQEGEWWRGWDY